MWFVHIDPGCAQPLLRVWACTAHAIRGHRCKLLGLMGSRPYKLFCLQHSASVGWGCFRQQYVMHACQIARALAQARPCASVRVIPSMLMEGAKGEQCGI